MGPLTMLHPTGTIIASRSVEVCVVIKAQNEDISPEVFDHLVHLASFQLEKDEATYLRTQLNSQLKAIRELAAIEVPDDIEATSHGVPYTVEISSPLRADEIEPCPEAEDIIESAPQTELGYIVVPDIPHEELE
jgi:aspartyl-tRNA(Asn)/glutamyl-tRNA(Gln) amidotransferase subunit C